MGAVAAGAAVDGDAADAVHDGGRALRDADDSAGVLAVGADGTANGAAAHGEHGAADHLAGDAGGIEVGGVVGALVGGDVDGDVAVDDINVAPHHGNESCRMAVVGGGDGGLYGQVFDDSMVSLAVA